jgi:hypothetical protein
MPKILRDIQRIDRAKIIGKIAKNDEGILQGTATVARSGILTYFENGKLINELVPPEELQKQDSLDSLKMRPVTNDHPSARLVTPANVKQFQCGFTGETVNCDGEVLNSSITINEAAAIRAVEDGKRELSAAYKCDLEITSGTWNNGQHYERIQRNRRYNHVAICDLGRAGAVASLHLDSADVYEVEIKTNKTDNSPFQRSRPMPVPITIKGIVYNDQAPEVAAALTEALQTVEAMRKDSQTAVAAVQTKLDAMTAERDATKTKLDAAQAEIAELPAKINAAGKARAELVAQATPHLDKADVEKIDTLTDAQIRLAVARKAFPGSKEKLDAVKADNAEAVSVWYDAALTVLKNDKTNSAASQNRQDVNGDPKNDKKDGEPVQKKDINDLWKENKKDSYAKKAEAACA